MQRLGHPKSVRLTLRLSPLQMDFIDKASRSLKFSVSDYLRFLINYHIAEEEKRYANNKTDKHD